jgi:TolA-binding protein
MKHKLKYLGIGLFIAGLVFSLGERFTIPYIESSKNFEAQRLEKEIASLNETISTLEEKVQQLNHENEELSKAVADNTTNTVITESTDATGSTSTGENSANQSNSSSNTSSSTSGVVTGTIYIYESVSLYDIGRQAEDLKIVENGRQLELFLSKPDYARSVQKGQFELSSDMTLEEMANILTGKQ